MLGTSWLLCLSRQAMFFAMFPMVFVAVVRAKGEALLQSGAMMCASCDVSKFPLRFLDIGTEFQLFLERLFFCCTSLFGHSKVTLNLFQILLVF